MIISIVGCGWLGLPFGEYLIEQGFSVKGSTTTEEKLEVLESKGIQSFLINLQLIVANKKETEKIDDFFKTDILYINIPPGRRNPNVLNDYPKWIECLAKKCEEFEIKKVIFISSTGIYPNTNRIVTEATTPKPKTDSQKAIVAAEQLLQQNQQFQTTILRPAGLVGGNRVAGRWFAGKQNVKGGNIPVNLVNLEDCIGVSYAIIEQNIFGKVLNVCADEHPIKGDFYTFQAQKHGFVPPTFLMEQADNFKIVSNEQSKKVLNYQYKKPNPMDF